MVIKKSYQIALIVAVSILSVIVLVVVVLLIVVTAYYKNAQYAIFNAFANRTLCTITPSDCDYVDYNPPLPTLISTTSYSPSVSFFVGQLVWNVDVQQSLGRLVVPSTLQQVGTIVTNETSAPTFGVVYLDTVNSNLYVTFRGTITANERNYDFEFGNR